MTTNFATATINEYNIGISEIEKQIQDLQQLLSQKQSELQNIQSIEQMGASASEQVMKTLAACDKAGQPQLAESFIQEVTAILNSTKDNTPALPAAAPDEETTTTIITPPILPTDDEILETIKALDSEHMTTNYLPIYLYRAALPQLTRKQQDEALYRLEAENCIELSTLQEGYAYTKDQIKSGIPQNIGGHLFFIIVTEEEKRRSLSTQPATKPVPASVGAAAAADIGIMDFETLKKYCLETLGLNKDDVRKCGKLTRRDTWVKAVKSRD